MDDEDRSDFTCQHPDCLAHPRDGDAIIRTSPKGGPFRGLCARHYAETQR